MYEVRFHGRGGQGAVMAAQTLAEAAVIEGNYAVAFPFFGAERRGAPVLAFTRIDSKKIYSRTQVYAPDCVVVLDDSLLDTIDVVAGLKSEGCVVINSRDKPDDIDPGKEIRTGAVDANSVALEILKAPITNTAILGAFAKVTGMVKLASIEEAIRTRFGEKLGANVGERNALAARTAYDRTVIGRSRGEKRVTYKPGKMKRVRDYLMMQGRFRHMSEEDIKTLQMWVCKKWNLHYNEKGAPEICKIEFPEEHHAVTEEHREMHGP